jgi:hypothetical protein
MANFKYQILSTIGEPIDTNTDSIKIKLRRISYNGNAGKLDLRAWRNTPTQGETMLKGLTLDDRQLKALYELLKGYYDGDVKEIPYKDTAEAPTEDKNEAK